MSASLLAESLARIQSGLQPVVPNPGGLYARLIVLRCMGMIALSAALCQLILLLITYRRSGGGWREHLWLFRYSSRMQQRLIITNTKLMSCIFAILGLTFNLGYLWDVDKIYLDYDSQASSGIWRGLFPAALVMHLSFVTWGQFQYLIAFGPSSSHAAPIAFPRIFNAVFVLSNTVFTMFLLAAGLTEAVSASKLWHGYMDIRTTAQPILDPSAGFPPNFNPFTLEATLTEQFTSFQKWVRIYNRTSLSSYATATTVALFSFLVNILAIIVALQARRRSIKEDAAAQPTVLALTLISSQTSLEQGSTQSAQKKEVASAPEIENRHQHSVFSAKAARVAARRRAERDLLLMACWCLFISAWSSGFGLWASTASPGRTGVTKASWDEFETAVLLLNWFHCSLMCLIYPMLLRAAWRKLPPARKSGRRLSVPQWLKRKRGRRPSAPIFGNVAPGAAPAGRVRVIIEERVREDIRLDMQGEVNGLETTIQGGVGVELPVDSDDSEGCSTLDQAHAKTEWIKPTWACAEHSDDQQTPEAEARQEPQRFRLPQHSFSAFGLWRGDKK